MRFGTTIRVMRSDGTILYNDVASNFLSEVTVADIDNNGCPEVYVQHGSYFKAINLCSNNYAQTLWSVDRGFITAVKGSAIGRVENTTGWDIVIKDIDISGNARVDIRNASTGASKTVINLGSVGSSGRISLPTLFDINGDGKDEIFVGVKGASLDSPIVYALNYNGIIWSKRLPPACCGTSDIAVGYILPANQIGLALTTVQGWKTGAGIVKYFWGHLYILRASRWKQWLLLWFSKYRRY